ncbi:hypothetical protein AZE42_04832 [Rhizopogon vesiculosus]|uniref:Uncharacterized protein n=1 Tax=Rhizopogon vesiculosus TaxID=180088 RepID=A0A1J8Q5P7_9AGAM|nr:hypothetical protein AZE42_04832 [Rhizopogon vesiculosus]
MAAPIGSNMARRTPIAGPSVIMHVIPRPIMDAKQLENADSGYSSMASSRDFVELATNTPVSGSMTSVLAADAGLVTRTIALAAPTGTSVAASTAKNEFANYFTFNLDESSLKLYTIGIILAEIQD